MVTDLSVRVDPMPGCVAPARGTGRALVQPGDDGEWSASWQAVGGTGTNECILVTCSSKAEAVEWALAQPASEWVICRDVDAYVWEHLR
jgi:hypothetical protein